MGYQNICEYVADGQWALALSLQQFWSHGWLLYIKPFPYNCTTSTLFQIHEFWHISILTGIGVDTWSMQAQTNCLQIFSLSNWTCFAYIWELRKFHGSLERVSIGHEVQWQLNCWKCSIVQCKSLFDLAKFTGTQGITLGSLNCCVVNLLQVLTVIRIWRKGSWLLKAMELAGLQDSQNQQIQQTVALQLSESNDGESRSIGALFYTKSL